MRHDLPCPRQSAQRQITVAGWIVVAVLVTYLIGVEPWLGRATYRPAEVSAPVCTPEALPALTTELVKRGQVQRDHAGVRRSIRWATLSGDDHRDGIAPHTDW
ncbi:hypothetical protein GCM10010151_41520 [Actinoallomurus spadix]|uniref:Uncharacterized protein n=1 Tax=Actinoallomurus spadix TaxID=79912 RepID=A0ABN0WV39_9ACTN